MSSFGGLFVFLRSNVDACYVSLTKGHPYMVVNMGRYLACFVSADLTRVGAGHRGALAPETTVDDLLQRVFGYFIQYFFAISTQTMYHLKHIWNGGDDFRFL